MNRRSTLSLIKKIQDPRTTYEELIRHIFGKSPVKDFFSEINHREISIIKSPAYDTEESFISKENPEASICFLITGPFHFYVYKNVYRHLPEAEFVIDGRWIRRNVSDWNGQLKRLIDFLKEEGVNFKILFPEDDPRKFFSKYSVFIYNTTIGYLDQFLTTQRRVRMMYGNSKDAYNFGPWSRYFDIALTYGEYSHRLMSSFTDSVVVGNPKFDDWFSGNSGKDSRTKALKAKLDRNKKTVLYLPTHGDLSSLEFMKDEMPALFELYNVIIRPHQVSDTVEKERMQNFKEAVSAANLFWADDYYDITGLFSISDAVLSDNSGAIFDAVLADKPLVLLDCISESEIARRGWDLKRRSKDSWIIAQTYPGSIEQRVKHDSEWMIAETVHERGALRSAVHRALEQDAFVNQRKRIRDILFSYQDARAGERAAREVRNCIGKLPREWNFLNYTTAEAVHNETIYFRQRSEDLFKIARSYVSLNFVFDENVTSETIEYSIIIPTYNGREGIRKTLHSILNQEFPKQRYEIIIVDDGSLDSSEPAYREAIKNHPEAKITYLSYAKNRGPAYARNAGICEARGKYICFTDDDADVPSDWLSFFERAFQENPELAGMGGWYEPEMWSVYSTFIHWQHFPFILNRLKSAGEGGGNRAGNTANLCLRRMVLIELGGFNHYFRFPSSEDWEIKTRIERFRLPLLYVPRMNRHRKHYSFFGFVRHYLLRGWAYHLRLLLTEEGAEVLRYTAWSFIPISLYEIQLFWERKRSTTVPQYVSFSLWFIPLIFVRNFCMWIGKYVIALEILALESTAD